MAPPDIWTSKMLGWGGGGGGDGDIMVNPRREAICKF